MHAHPTQTLVRRLRKALPWVLVSIPLMFAARAATDFDAVAHPDPAARSRPSVADGDDLRPAPSEPRQATARTLLKLTTSLQSTAGAHVDTAERSLVRVYALIADGKLGEAIPLAESLVHSAPRFGLAQLALADAYRARAGAGFGFADMPGPSPDEAEQLAMLRTEARMRVEAYAEAPPANAIPANLIALAPDVQHAIVVDTAVSRVYLFSVRDGKPTLEADYYFSQGKLGAGKTKAGDMKTPLGIYFITRKIDATKLKPIYGAGALTLNYPNEWDKRAGHTGLGIWLHGNPPDTYARVPLASDGCVVLSNPDVLQLMSHVAAGATPVIITRKIRWLGRADWETRRARTLADLQRQVHEAAAQGLRPQDAGADPKLASDDRAMAQDANLRPGNYTVVEYPGQMVVQYQSSTATLYRQYWAQSGGGWQLIFQGSVS